MGLDRRDGTSLLRGEGGQGFEEAVGGAQLDHQAGKLGEVLDPADALGPQLIGAEASLRQLDGRLPEQAEADSS